MLFLLHKTKEGWQWLCRRLQAAVKDHDEADVNRQQINVHQEFEAEIASMALAVLVRLTANAGQTRPGDSSHALCASVLKSLDMVTSGLCLCLTTSAGLV